MANPTERAKNPAIYCAARAIRDVDKKLRAGTGDSDVNAIWIMEEEKARSCLKAVREPSDLMLDAAIGEFASADKEELRRAWKIMIDTILADA